MRFHSIVLVRIRIRIGFNVGFHIKRICCGVLETSSAKSLHRHKYKMGIKMSEDMLHNHIIDRSAPQIYTVKSL